MRRTTVLLTTLGMLLVGASVFAETTASKPVALQVTAADISQAGYTKVAPITPTPDGRWKGPTTYFTTNAYVARGDEKRDCAECQNVVAAYAAVSPTVPGWSLNQRVFVRKIAGRWQGRVYLADKKIVIVVTGPYQELVTRLLGQLKAKFAA